MAIAKKKKKQKTKLKKTKSHQDPLKNVKDDWDFPEISWDDDVEPKLQVKYGALEAPDEQQQELSLGARLGTISMLENMPISSLPEAASKAGLQIKLAGARVALTENGQPLTLDELKTLATWILAEVAKASEAYNVEI